MKKGVSWWVPGGIVIVVSIVLVCYLLIGDGKAPFRNGKDIPRHTSATPSENLAGMREIVKSYMDKNGKVQRSRTGRLLAGLDRSMFDNFSESDRKLCEAVQEALDADDAAKTIELATELISSDNPEVRSHAVDALGWFAAEALPELTMLMGDSDEDVAQNAINAWESGVSEIDDATARLKISGMALKAIFSKDALQSIGAQFSNAATELIDAEEDPQAAFDKRVEVVQSIVELINTPNPTLSDEGRDLYEDITGHEWISLYEAERYLNDPDNYEPPTDEAMGATAEVPDMTGIAPVGEADEKAMASESTVTEEEKATESAVTEEEKASDEESANLIRNADSEQDTDSNQ